jgi:hypothetical protein
VRTVWRLYGGWWDGNPATLKPAPERSLALELADLAGGAGALADRALALIDTGGSGDTAGGGDGGGDPDDGRNGTEDEAMRLAGHLAELAWLAAPGDPGIQATRRTVFARRADASSSTMAHGVFSWAARETGDHGRDGPSRP